MQIKKILCIILSLLFVAPCFCFTSCDSASIGDLDIDNGTSPGNKDQEQDGSKTPFYIAPAKYKELAKDDTVYRLGIYTGYSIIVKYLMKSKEGRVTGSNLGEVLLDYPGEVYPFHEDPTCKHDSVQCPTAANTMEKRGVVVRQDNGLPLIFYFGLFTVFVQTEDGTAERATRVAEARGYDVETGEFTSIAGFTFGDIRSALLYKGKLYITGTCDGSGADKVGMIDIVTGEFKSIEREASYNEYNLLGIVNNRLWYIHIAGEEGVQIIDNKGTIESCSLDLDDVRTEYDLGIYHKINASDDVYMDGDTIYFPKNYHELVDPASYSPRRKYYNKNDLEVFDLYALDVNKLSESEKPVVHDVYRYAVKNGKLYYTLVDYKEVSEVKYIDTVETFASTDGGTVYEYDVGTGETRKVCTDSGYNIYNIYEITDDGKMFFRGIDYVNYITAEEGYYHNNVGHKDYCMLDLATGEVSEIWANDSYELYEDSK